MHAFAYKYIQTTDDDNVAKLSEIILIGIAALETIENCPQCKNELNKKVKSDANQTAPQEQIDIVHTGPTFL
jgi:uncharacterized protein with PIN domain